MPSTSGGAQQHIKTIRHRDDVGFLEWKDGSTYKTNAVMHQTLTGQRGR